MQPIKDKKFKGELTTLIDNESGLESKLDSVMSLFALKKHLSVFNPQLGEVFHFVVH